MKSTYFVEIGNIYLAPHLIRVNKGKKVSETLFQDVCVCVCVLGYTVICISQDVSI